MIWRNVLAWVATGLIGCAGLTAATQPKKKPTNRKATAPAAKKGTAKKAAPTKATSTKTTGQRSRRTLTAHAAKAPVRSTWHPTQTAPTPDRYKEIQQALAQKGYLHGEPTGVWGQDSTDALRRFQHDQNLDASGKLDSLSIIALGLGPKR